MSEPAATTRVNSEPAHSLSMLLAHVVDYAGLFPPASLGMQAATREYADQQGGADAWALGRFVVPAARLEEFEEAASDVLPRESSRSWALSALMAGDLEESIALVERFNARHGDARSGAVLVDTVELKAHTQRDVARAAELLDRRFDTYMEIPVVEDPGPLIAAISDTHGRAKVRTGGVSADAFPSIAQMARFIRQAVRQGVSFKATAGLHHPIRAEYRLTYEPQAPTGTMYGFLNVLLATAMLCAGAEESVAASLLEERDFRAICFDAGGVTWRDARLNIEDLGVARRSMIAFGSCSFREPISDLRALGLL